MELIANHSRTDGLPDEVSGKRQFPENSTDWVKTKEVFVGKVTGPFRWASYLPLVYLGGETAYGFEILKLPETHS
jgi:hypothetical protein